jgi:hypothetical protein
MFGNIDLQTISDFNKGPSFLKTPQHVGILRVCGELATPLLTVKPVGVYSTTLVQYLYISCYLSDNKPVLSYLLSCLLQQVKKGKFVKGHFTAHCFVNRCRLNLEC